MTLNPFKTRQHEKCLGLPNLIMHNLLADLRWDTHACRRRKHRLTLLYKLKHGFTPNYLEHMIPNQSQDRYPLRNAESIPLLKVKTQEKNITDSPRCICNAIETCSHFLLNCPLYVNQRHHHLNNIPWALTLDF